jgi:hypothetical protein
MPLSSSPDRAMRGSPAAIDGGVAAWIATNTDRILLVAILGALAIKFVLIARININWDEFYFLEMTHQYVQGALTGRFQTFHVHLFSWLPRLGWDEIDQIVAGRVVMQILSVGSAILTYQIARQFVTRSGALFALLAYLSFSAVIEHGAAFRVDPIVAFLSLLSLFAILCRPAGLRGAMLAGGAMALACLITVKSAFYLVVIAGALWCIGHDMRDRLKLGLVSAASFLLATAALYLFHDAVLATQAADGAGSFLRSSASKVFSDGLFPRASDLISLMIANPLFWLMLIEGAAVAWAVARKPENWAGWAALLPFVLALPVLTPILYRNAFPYFYPFILPPAALLVGFSFDKHRQAAPKPNAIPAVKLTAALVAVQCAILVFGSAGLMTDGVRPQRQTIAQVRAIFPDSVPYIEGFGVFAAYPRSGFFMSSWGVDNYREAGEPIFADLAAKDQPLFVLADSPSLYGALVPGIAVDEDRTLLPEDIRFLQENYVRQWGMLFVAGKHLRSPERAFAIAVAGEYRLEAVAPAVIDGNRTEPDGVVTLATGDHTIDLGGAGDATLRWAAAPQASAPVPTDPLTFFQRKSWAGMKPEMMRADRRASRKQQP